MRILALSAEMPFPPVGGGLLRTHHWLKSLAARHDVTLIAFTFGEGPSTPDLPITAIGIPWALPAYRAMEADDPVDAHEAFIQLRDHTSVPWYASYFESAPFVEAVRRETAKGTDVVFIEDSDMGLFIGELPEGTPRILDMQNVYALMSQRAEGNKTGAELEAAQHEARRTLAFERHVAAQCDVCLACSDAEAGAARRLLGLSRVEVLPNGVDTNYFNARNDSIVPGRLLFTGSMDYPPNIEAVEYFSREIFPAILRQRPHATFHVVGAKPGDSVRRLHSDQIRVHGLVPDVRPHFAAAEVVVAPILSGGGTRFKILEAAASGKPIVTTTLGAEGLDLRHDRDVLVSNTAGDFARNVVDVMGDRSRQVRLGSHAREASLRYDWGRIEDRLCELVSALTTRGHNTSAG